MPLMKWEPFEELVSLQDRINKIFEESFPRSRKEGLMRGGWTPPVDIAETADALLIKAEIPGIKPEEIDIQITGDTLTIKGERKQEKEEKGKNYHRIERSYGSFHRSFSLGIPVKEKEVKATYKDGILEINIPKAEEAKPRQIKIKVE